MASPSNEYKKLGNTAFEKADFIAAIDYFTQALAYEENHIFYSNRSAAWCSIGRYDLAEADARRVVQLQPQWPKGYRRLATALRGLRRYEEAVDAAHQGASGDDNNPDYVEACGELSRLQQELRSISADLDEALASAQRVQHARWHVEALKDNIWLDGGAGSPPFRPQTIFVVDAWAQPPRNVGLVEMHSSGPAPAQRVLEAIVEPIRAHRCAPESVNFAPRDAPLVHLLGPILSARGIATTCEPLGSDAAAAVDSLVKSFEQTEEAQWVAENRFDHVITQRRCVSLTEAPGIERAALEGLLAAAAAFYRCKGVPGLAARPIGIAVHPTPPECVDVVLVAGEPPHAAGASRNEFGVVVLSSQGVAGSLAVPGDGPGGVAPYRSRVFGSLAQPLLTYAFTDVSSIPFHDADEMVGAGFRIPSTRGYPRVTRVGLNGEPDSTGSTPPTRGQVLWLTAMFAALAEFASDSMTPSSATQTVVVPTVDGRTSVTVVIPPPADFVPSTESPSAPSASAPEATGASAALPAAASANAAASAKAAVPSSAAAGASTPSSQTRSASAAPAAQSAPPPPQPSAAPAPQPAKAVAAAQPSTRAMNGHATHGTGGVPPGTALTARGEPFGALPSSRALVPVDAPGGQNTPDAMVWRARASHGTHNAGRQQQWQEREALLRSVVDELLGGSPRDESDALRSAWLEERNSALSAEVRSLDAEVSKLRSVNASLTAAAVQSAAKERFDAAALATAQSRITQLERHVAQLVSALSLSAKVGGDGSAVRSPVDAVALAHPMAHDVDGVGARASARIARTALRQSGSVVPAASYVGSATRRGDVRMVDSRATTTLRAGAGANRSSSLSAGTARTGDGTGGALRTSRPPLPRGVSKGGDPSSLRAVSVGPDSDVRRSVQVAASPFVRASVASSAPRGEGLEPFGPAHSDGAVAASTTAPGGGSVFRFSGGGMQPIQGTRGGTVPPSTGLRVGSASQGRI